MSEKKLETFDTDVYARTSENNMPLITSLTPLSEQEQKEVEEVFTIAL
ncbi:hypothetical protein [Brevibacillus borstelensis]